MGIFATIHRDIGGATPEGGTMGWEGNVHFAVSDDGFKTFAIRGYCGEQFEVIGNR